VRSAISRLRLNRGLTRRLALVLCLVGTTALGAIDALLGAMHGNGEPGFGVTSTTGLGGAIQFIEHGTTNVKQALATWQAWHPVGNRPFVSPHALVEISLATDLLFIIGYALLLVSLASLVSQRLESHAVVASPEDPKTPGSPEQTRRAAYHAARHDEEGKEEPNAHWDEDSERVSAAAAWSHVGRATPRPGKSRWSWMLLLITLAACFDLVEDASLWILVHRNGSSSFTLVMACATILKWVTLGLFLARLSLSLVTLASLYRRELRGLGAALWTLRLPLALTAVFVVLTSPIDQQVVDVLLRWQLAPTLGFANLVVGLALTFLLGAVLMSVCSSMAAAGGGGGSGGGGGGSGGATAVAAAHRRDRRVLVLGIALVVLGAVLSGVGWGGIGIIVAGALLIVIGGAGMLLGDPAGREVRRDRTTVAIPQWLAFVVGSLPCIALGLALLRSGLIEGLYGEHWTYLGLTGLGTVIVWAAVDRLPASWTAVSKAIADRRTPIRVVAWLGVLAVAVALAIRPIVVGQFIGTVGAVAAFLVAALLLVELASLARPVTLFRIAGMRTTPIVLLLVTWLLVGSAIDKGASFHDVRVRNGSTGIAPISLGTAFNDWLTANGLDCIPLAAAGPASSEPSCDGPAPAVRSRLAKLHARQKAIPLVLVSTAGGGIRAAYWTSLVLDCILDAGSEAPTCGTGKTQVGATPSPSVFIASGISGGSLGLVSYAAHVVDPRDGANWVDEQLRTDGVAPTVAWGLFADAPNALLRLHLPRDRATVLEQAWEAADPTLRMSFLANWSTAKRARTSLTDGVPFLMLNGTSVVDGCQFNTSILNFGIASNAAPEQRVNDCLRLSDGSLPLGGTVGSMKDITDFLGDRQDVRLSTAALLSARFPYVTPAGRLTPHDKESTLSTSYIVDGGYYESSGIAPLRDIWTAIEPLVAAYNAAPTHRKKIVPIFIAIDNHYSSTPAPTADPSPLQLLVPLQAAGTVRDGHDIADQQAIERTFSSTIDGIGGQRFFYFHPYAHPGVQAPLGWVLSSASRSDLLLQLQQETTDIHGVRCWLSGGCT
jgi:hypothetical protein